jgi:hypothetical protein
MYQRITEDFVRHHKLLVEWTGNTPHGIRRALERHPDVAISIRELHILWLDIETHRKVSKRRFLIQTHRAFPKALDDYRARWLGAIVDLFDWKAEKAGREPISVWLERQRADISSQPSAPKAQEDDDWDFDSDEHSAASHIEAVADYIGYKVDDGRFSPARTEHSTG